MATQVQFRRGTTAEHSGFKGADGEVTVDTSLKTVVIHDAITNGGFPLLRQDGSNSLFSKSGDLNNCALKFNGDPNTGLISPVNDELSLVTGGVAPLTIDSNASNINIVYYNHFLKGALFKVSNNSNDGRCSLTKI